MKGVELYGQVRRMLSPLLPRPGPSPLLHFLWFLLPERAIYGSARSRRDGGRMPQ